MEDVNSRVADIKKRLKIFDDIKFDEGKHEYTYNGIKARISMTSLIGKYKPGFNREYQAKKYAKKHDMLYEDVLSDWTFKAVRSTTKGTAIHKYLEESFKGLDYEPNYENLLKYNVTESDWKTLTNQADNLKKEIDSHLIVLGSELKIFDPTLKIGGAIDLLVYHPKLDEIFIIDFKSNNKIERENKYNQFMKYPISNLPNINYIHYSLQTNGYQYIIEKMTGLKLRCTHFLAHLNEEKNEYELIPTLDLTEQFKSIITDYKDNL